MAIALFFFILISNQHKLYMFLNNFLISHYIECITIYISFENQFVFWPVSFESIQMKIQLECVLLNKIGNMLYNNLWRI